MSPSPDVALSAFPGPDVGTMRYRNPILPGFYPDPSVCRVGEDFYLVNSSFEYFPGVPIFHSRDLIHWRQLGHVLDRPSQLEIPGVAPSDGIYAPTIRHHAGRFYLATTVNVTGRGFRNFFVTAENPAGPWSDPIWVNQGGIDPSLFFDDDGRVFWTGNGTGWATVRGLYQSEIDPASGTLLSEPRLIWTGSGGSYPEGPHLFKRDGFYYLLAAEGGTAECHMVTCARSRQPFGPFEPCPFNPVLTHRSRMNIITSTGHADFFSDAAGDWWAVFLAIRYAEHGFHPLGRETCLAPVEWTADGWPVVNGGALVAERMEVARDLPARPLPPAPVRDDFDSAALGPDWVRLRLPAFEDYSLNARPGWLTLRCAAPALDDLASPAAVFRRLRHFEATARAWLDFEPASEREEAGLTVLIDQRHHAELVVARRGDFRVAFVRRRIGSLAGESEPLPIPSGPFEISVAVDRARCRFFATAADGVSREIGRHETRYLATEVAGGYTGVMLGLFASGRGAESAVRAAFDWFDYEPGHP